MELYQHKSNVQAGDLVQLVSLSKKIYFIRLNPGDQLQTHRGVIKHDDLIGQSWGNQVSSHLGSPYFLLQPSLHDILKETRRATQILYPKDIGFILVRMSIGPGAHIIEAGTGSGALTSALAWAVGPHGSVTSYEIRPDVQNLARKNLERLGLSDRVTFKLRDIADGFDERQADALFLDLPNPQDYIAQSREALKPGGSFGSILPTTNQVTELLTALRRHHFTFTDVCEILLRYYKSVPERLRPTDRMVAHTGYLIFSCPVIPADDSPGDQDSTLDDGLTEEDIQDLNDSEVNENV
jgi:tRNA (adenine57-N1/adenine58-N1)-methyltransferase